MIYVSGLYCQESGAISVYSRKINSDTFASFEKRKSKS